MPFQYQQYHNPFVGSLSDLMMRPAEAQAAAAERIGQYQAAAQQQSGQAWAGAANQTGQAISGAVQQATDPRRKLEGLQVQQAQQGISDLKSLDNAFTQPGGRDAIIQALPGHLRPAVMKQFQDADASAASVQEAQLKAEDATTSYVQTLAEIAKAHEYDPAALQLGLSHARDTFKNNPSLVNQIGQFEQLLQANPTAATVKSIVDPILAAKEAQEKPVILPATPRGGAPAQLIKPSGGAPVATGLPAPPQQPNESELALQAAGGDPAKAMSLLKPTPQTSNEWKDVLLDGKPAKVFVDPKTQIVKDLAGNTVDNAVSRIKPIPPASMTINPQLVPSGDALDMAAKRYLLTGDLPSMGMGQAGAAARVAVMNRAAQIDPQASLSANKATYKADTANLQKLQTTEGTLSAFEKTAGKNLDQFLSLADKIPDTGVPWLNQPLRAVNASGLGSSDQAAFNAARDVALREIARVTNDPKLSGSLTDSARAEVAGLSPANATFAQIKAVAKVLKQDMANVHSGINEQISNVKAGLQGHPGAPPASAPLVPTLRFNPATGKVEPVKSGGDD